MSVTILMPGTKRKAVADDGDDTPMQGEEPKKKRSKSKMYSDAEKEEAVTSLKYIDPDCNEIQWKKVASYIRQIHHDDEKKGFQHFCEWNQKRTMDRRDEDECKRGYFEQPPCKTPGILGQLGKMAKAGKTKAITPDLESDYTIGQLIKQEGQETIKVTDQEKFCGYVYDHKAKYWTKQSKPMILALIPEILKQWKEKRGLSDKDLKFTTYGSIFSASKSKSSMVFAQAFLYDPKFLEKLDKYPTCLPTKGGKVVNLETLKIRDRTQEDYWSFELPGEFKLSEEKIKDFKERFHRIVGQTPEETLDLETNSDKQKRLERLYFQTFPVFFYYLCTLMHTVEERSYLRWHTGYCMIESGSDRIVLINNGHGKGGKSRFYELLVLILIDHKLACTPNESIFADSTRRTPGAASPDLSQLEGKRLSVVPETARCQLDDGPLRRLASGGLDGVSCRGLYQGTRSFPIRGALVINANYNAVTLTSCDQATRDRLRVLHFRSRFLSRNDLLQDPTLESKLFDPSQFPPHCLEESEDLDRDRIRANYHRNELQPPPLKEEKFLPLNLKSFQIDCGHDLCLGADFCLEKIEEVIRRRKALLPSANRESDVKGAPQVTEELVYILEDEKFSKELGTKHLDEILTALCCSSYESQFLMKARSGHIPVPPLIQEYTNRYLDSQDIVAIFVKTCCEVVPAQNNGDSLHDIYQGFSRFLQGKGKSTWGEEKLERCLIVKRYMSGKSDSQDGGALSRPTRLRLTAAFKESHQSRSYDNNGKIFSRDSDSKAFSSSPLNNKMSNSNLMSRPHQLAKARSSSNTNTPFR
jgi:hypothetical protein